MMMRQTRLFSAGLLLMLALFATMAKAQTTEQWWGYWTSPMGLQQVGELAHGSNVMGIRLTAQNTKAVGAKLHAFRFYISDKTSVVAARVWASSRQSAGYNLLDVEIPLGNLKDLAHDGEPTTIVLDQPADLLQKGNAYANMYIGFDITMPETGSFTPCQMMASGQSTGVVNANLYDWKTVENTCGPLAMQLLISNDDIPATGATALIPEGLIVVGGEPFTVDIPIRNDGMEGLQRIDYEWLIDGMPSWEDSYTFAEPVNELDAMPTMPVTITPPSEATWHSLGLNILAVNGKDVGGLAEEKPMLVVDQLGEKRTVMEEFTGTWCPNCPRGTVGIENLTEIFGQRFIPIAVHNDDPMTIADYDGSQFRRSVTGAMGGFPAATVDRTFKCDPYMGYELRYEFNSDKIVAEALQRKAVADIEVTASWSSDGENAVDVRARTTYYYSSDECNHALTLVLTADGLTGDEAKWLQVNEFMGRTDLPEDMSRYVNGERRMKEIYNHVAVAVAGVENGISGSISTPLVSQQPQEFTQTLTFPASLRQDNMVLRAVAMLIDTTTGQVVNAAVSEPLNLPTGILSIEHSTLNIDNCYDLQGRLVYRGYEGTSRGYEGTSRGYEGAKVRGYENSDEGNLAPSHPRTPAPSRFVPSMKKGIYIVGNKKLVFSR